MSAAGGFIVGVSIGLLICIVGIVFQAEVMYLLNGTFQHVTGWSLP
jgi:hypothetical protein